MFAMRQLGKLRWITSSPVSYTHLDVYKRQRRAHWHPNVLYLLDQFQAVRFSELETISLQAEMKAALRQAIDQLYEEYVGIHLKAKKFIDSLSDWGAIMKDSSGGET